LQPKQKEPPEKAALFVLAAVVSPAQPGVSAKSV
jgi:hypothetical protein